MTIDDDLSKLENFIRRMKIDCAAYLNGGSPRPPTALIFRIESTIRKYSAGSVELTIRQRFRLNSLAQSYAVQNGLWRRKLRQKERSEEAAPKGALPSAGENGPFSLVWTTPGEKKLAQLLDAVCRAQSEAGADSITLEPARFATFMREKTQEFQTALGCDSIRISVLFQDGKVKLRATRADEEHEQAHQHASGSSPTHG
jgi:hypothetical protein